MHRRLSISTPSLGEARLTAHGKHVAPLGAMAIGLTLEEVMPHGPARAGRLLDDCGLVLRR